MINTREELEKIIKDNLDFTYMQGKWEGGKPFQEELKINTTKLTQAILDKLIGLVEIDEAKLETPLIYHIKGRMSANELYNLAHDIVSFKPIRLK